MKLFGALTPTDERLLALALDMLALRLRGDGYPLPGSLRTLRELLATDLSRLEPTTLDESAERADTGPVLYDFNEAAARMRVHRRTVERAAKAGELATVSIGRAKRVHPDDLADYIAAQRGATGTRSAGVAIPADARRSTPHSTKDKHS